MQPYGYSNYYGNPYYSNQQNNMANQQQAFQQQTYQQPMYQSQNYQVQNTQQNYVPLTFVNGIVGAKAFIVAPNQTIYLKDSDSNMLFIKKADNMGKYEIKAYDLTEIDLDKPKTEENDKKSTLESVDISQLAFKTDIESLQAVFNENMSKLSTEIKNALKTNLKEKKQNE